MALLILSAPYCASSESMSNVRAVTETVVVTSTMKEWCRVLATGGYIKGWVGCTIGCSAGNGNGVHLRISFVMVEKLLKAGLITWETYQVEGISLNRTRAILTEAGKAQVK